VRVGETGNREKLGGGFGGKIAGKLLHIPGKRGSFRACWPDSQAAVYPAKKKD